MYIKFAELSLDTNWIVIMCKTIDIIFILFSKINSGRKIADQNESTGKWFVELFLDMNWIVTMRKTIDI